MRAKHSPHIRVKAAGGVRTLDGLLSVMELGVSADRGNGDRGDHPRLPSAARQGHGRPPPVRRRGERVLMRDVGIGMLGSGSSARFHALWLR